MILAASIGTDLFRGVLQGAPPGAVYALIAVGFVLTYKTSGVFNLAFGAQAYVSAALYFKARTEWHWGALPAFVLAVVIVAPLLGLALEWLIFRHLRTASAVSKLVVTIGLAVAIPALFDILANFTAIAGKTPVGIAPDGSKVFYDPFGVYKFSRDELVTMGIAVLATLALGALFKFTALGLRMRAVVESPRMTELDGIPADRVSAFAWTLSSFFAGLAGVLIAPRFNTLAADNFFNLVVVAIAAAAVGQPREPAQGAGRRVGVGRVHRALQHVPAPLVERLHVAAADPGQPHAGDPVPGAVRGAGVRAEHPPHERESATRWPTWTRRRARWARSCATVAARSSRPRSGSGCWC